MPFGQGSALAGGRGDRRTDGLGACVSEGSRLMIDGYGTNDCAHLSEGLAAGRAPPKPCARHPPPPSSPWLQDRGTLWGGATLVTPERLSSIGRSCGDVLRFSSGDRGGGGCSLHSQAGPRAVGPRDVVLATCVLSGAFPLFLEGSCLKTCLLGGSGRGRVQAVRLCLRAPCFLSLGDQWYSLSD